LGVSEFKTEQGKLDAKVKLLIIDVGEMGSTKIRLKS
jgi:hypothetical protein